MLTKPTGLLLTDLTWRDTAEAERVKEVLSRKHGLHNLDDILDYEVCELNSHVSSDVHMWTELCYALKLSGVTLDEDWSAFVQSVTKHS